MSALMSTNENRPHCPACAGQTARDFAHEEAGLDVAERAAWSHALVYFFWIGRAATPEEVDKSRPFVCDDARTQRRAA